MGLDGVDPKKVSSLTEVVGSQDATTRPSATEQTGQVIDIFERLGAPPLERLPERIRTEFYSGQRKICRAREVRDMALAKSLPEAADQVISSLCDAVKENPLDPQLVRAFFEAAKTNPEDPRLKETMQFLMGASQLLA